MKNLVLILGAVLLPCLAHAAGVTNKAREVYSATVTADALTPTGFCFPDDAEDIVFVLDATYNSGSSTLDVKMQDSDVATAGSNHWKDISGATFTQVTTSSAYHTTRAACGTALRRCIRPVVDVGASGSPNYTLTVKAFYRVRK